MKHELVFPGASWERLSGHLRVANSERMAFGYGGISVGGEVTRFLVREVDLCADTDYGFQGRGE